MKSLVFPLVAACLVTFAGDAHAGDPAQRAVRKAQHGVKSIDRRVTRAEQSGKQLEKRRGQSIARKFEKVRLVLTSLPADNSAAAAARAQLAKLGKRFVALGGQLIAAPPTLPGQPTMSADALLASPSYDKDRERMLVFTDLFKRSTHLSASSTMWASIHASALDALFADVPSIAAARTGLDALHAKWHPVARVSSGRARFVAVALTNALQTRAAYLAAANKFRAEYAAHSARHAGLAVSSAHKALAAKNYRGFLDTVARHGSAARKLLALRKLMGSLAAAEEQKLTTTLARMNAQITTMQTKAGAQLIASNRAPKTSYGGRDRATIERLAKLFWHKTYAKERVLSVRVPRGWDRRSGLRWNHQRSSWQRYDDSWMRVTLVAKHSATVATMHRVYLRRNHLASGKAQVTTASHRPASPLHQLLIKNL